MQLNKQEAKHKWYLKNRSRLLEKAKVYREIHKKEIADYKKEYRLQHSEYLKNYWKEFLAKNPLAKAKLIESRRKYYKRIRSDPLLWEKYLLKCRERRRRFFERHGDEARAKRSRYRKERYKLHRAEELLHQRATRLRTKDGRIITNVQKRPFPNGMCEICGKKPKKLSYHHWTDSDTTKGIWLCCNCHMMAEGIDKGFHEQYLSLKQVINMEQISNEQLKNCS